MTDGENEYKIHNINAIVRGAIIPPGKKKFKMYFEPNDVQMGNRISNIIFALLALLVIISLYRKNEYVN